MLKKKESKKSINETIESKLGEKARNRCGKNNKSINKGENRERARKKCEKSIVEKKKGRNLDWKN